MEFINNERFVVYRVGVDYKHAYWSIWDNLNRRFVSHYTMSFKSLKKAEMKANELNKYYKMSIPKEA